MKIDKNQVLEVLSSLKDPVTGDNIVRSGRIKEILIEEDGSKINCKLHLPVAFTEQEKSKLNFDSIALLQERFPETNVHVHLETDMTKGKSSQTILPQVSNFIAVASGKGGVGKSTVSVNLAIALNRLGFKVGLLDADLYGPSIPGMTGLKGQRPNVKEVDGKPKIVPLEAFGLPVMSLGFIVEADQAVVLRGPRLAGIIKQFIQECIWDPLDFLIIDLPPGTGDIQLTLVQTVPITGVIMVTTPQDVALADAIKAMNMFRMPAIDVPIVGVVENMSWFTPKELPDTKYYLFGRGGGKKLAEIGSTELLGQIPIVQGIMQSGEDGKPAALDETKSGMGDIWLEVARKTDHQVRLRNERYDPTKVVEVKN
jgi:ATP-binding protein involved in chromosome partitioning